MSSKPSPDDLYAVLSTGGTGGHVFPAVALAEQLATVGITPIIWVDERGRDYLPTGWPHPVRVVLARRRASGAFDRLRMIPAIIAATFKGIHHMSRANVAVAFGGYASLPGALAALLRGVPLVLHEQNATSGLANRALSKFAAQIAISWNSENKKTHRTTYVGNPVRRKILEAGEQKWSPPDEANPIHILATGGSQGARLLTRHVAKSCAALPDALQRRIKLRLQCQKAEQSEIMDILDESNVQAHISPFFSDMASELKTADLVICRAGSSSLSELACVGRPAIIVPFPHSAGGHQDANAHLFTQKKAGWHLPESELGASLSSLMTYILSNPKAADSAARNMRKLVRKDAAFALAQLCIEIAFKKRGAPDKLSKALSKRLGNQMQCEQKQPETFS